MKRPLNRIFPLFFDTFSWITKWNGRSASNRFSCTNLPEDPGNSKIARTKIEYVFVSFIHNRMVDKAMQI